MEVKQKESDSESNFDKPLKSYLNVLSVRGLRGSLCLFLDSETLPFLTHQTSVYNKSAAVKEILPHSNNDGDHDEYHDNNDY